MLEGLSTNATVAKIRTVFGNALTSEDYHEMTNKTSVAELCEYLKSTERFAGVLEDVESSSVHRGYLEELIKKAGFMTYLRLVKFQGLDKNEFFKFYIKRTEILQLINFLHMYEAGLQLDYLAAVPGYVTEYSDVPLLELSGANNAGDILRILRKTEYYKPLKRLIEKSGGEPELSSLELAVRKYYYNTVLRNARKYLSEGEAAELKRLIGIDADLINFTNAYRMKHYFGFDGDTIEKKSLPFTRLGRTKMKRLYHCETSEDMIAFMDETVYKTEESFEHIEVRNARSRLKAVRHVISTTQSAGVALYAYTMICDIEVSNIVHIIEGIRYKADLSEIEKEVAV